MKISLKKSGENVEILENGKRVATSSADTAEATARARGGDFIGFDEFVSEDAGVVSSSSVRKDIKDRGQDPSKTEFTSEDKFNEFKSRVQPEGGAPKRGEKRVDEFTRLREDAGIEDIDTELETNVSEQDELLAGFEKFKLKEAEGVSLGHASGRITEEQRNVQERIDILQRRETILNNRLKTKNAAIETTMNLTDKDFETARKDYEFDFNKNLAVQTAFKSEETAQMSHDRATYSTITNMFANSNKSFVDLTSAQQQQIQELEVKIGLPVGTFESLAITKPKANVIQTGKSTDESGNEFAWMMVQGKDGIPEMITTATGGFKAPAKTDEQKASEKKVKFDQGRQFIDQNTDGSFAELKTQLIEQGLNSTEATALLEEKGRSSDEVFLDDSKLKSVSTALLKAASKFGVDKADELKAATAQIRSGSITVKGKKIKLTPAQQDKIVGFMGKGRSNVSKVLPGGE